MNKLIIPAMLLLTSCVTRKACERRFPAREYDSSTVVTNTVTVYRDTTIYITLHGDTVYESVPVDKVSRLKTPLARSVAWIEGGKLKHVMVQKDTTLAQTLKGAITMKSTAINKNQVVKKDSGHLTTWQLIQIWFGRVMGVVVISLLLFAHEVSPRRASK